MLASLASSTCLVQLQHQHFAARLACLPVALVASQVRHNQHACKLFSWVDQSTGNERCLGHMQVLTQSTMQFYANVMMLVVCRFWHSLQSHTCGQVEVWRAVPQQLLVLSVRCLVVLQLHCQAGLRGDGDTPGQLLPRPADYDTHFCKSSTHTLATSAGSCQYWQPWSIRQPCCQPGQQQCKHE